MVTFYTAFKKNMVTNLGSLKTETDKMDRSPPIMTHNHDLWTLLSKTSLFPERHAMIVVAVKNES